MGSSANLMTRYSGAGSEGSNATIVGAGAATYFFNTQLLRNVFASNMNVWWQFNKTDKLLVIGVNNTSLGNVVTETFDQLPWLTWVAAQRRPTRTPRALWSSRSSSATPSR